MDQRRERLVLLEASTLERHINQSATAFVTLKDWSER